MKIKYILIAVLVVLVLGFLFAWPKFTDSTRPLVKAWNEAGIDCLSNGHQNLGQHIHPNLEVIIDGGRKTIPANVGIVNSCMAEVHTHDTTGKIHIESVLSDKKFKLKDFFLIWGEELNKSGYTIEMIVNGQPYLTDPGELILTDLQQIIVKYIKTTGA